MARAVAARDEQRRKQHALRHEQQPPAPHKSIKERPWKSRRGLGEDPAFDVQDEYVFAGCVRLPLSRACGVLTFFDSAQCLMVRRWRLIGHFPILYNPRAVSSAGAHRTSRACHGAAENGRRTRDEWRVGCVSN